MMKLLVFIQVLLQLMDMKDFKFGDHQNQKTSMISLASPKMLKAVLGDEGAAAMLRTAAFMLARAQPPQPTAAGNTSRQLVAT